MSDVTNRLPSRPAPAAERRCRGTSARHEGHARGPRDIVAEPASRQRHSSVGAVAGGPGGPPLGDDPGRGTSHPKSTSHWARGVSASWVAPNGIRTPAPLTKARTRPTPARNGCANAFETYGALVAMTLTPWRRVKFAQPVGPASGRVTEDQRQEARQQTDEQHDGDNAAESQTHAASKVRKMSQRS